MKVCRTCQKAWNDKGSITVGSSVYWALIKKAEITWCGVCSRTFINEFELQFKRRLRLEAKNGGR